MRWVLVVLVGCGRIGFDPLAGGDASSESDTGGTAGLPPAGENCASATPLAFGTSGMASLAGAVNDVSAGLCPDGVDIVYRVSSPADALHHLTISATFSGALNKSTTCPPISGSCTGIIAGSPVDTTTNFPAGTVYLIIDKTSGAGTTFELTLE